MTSLNIAIGPFVEMAFESRASCGKIVLFVGMDYEIGLVVEIGLVMGIGLFGGTGPFVSLTYIYLSLFALPGHLRMLLTSIIVTNS